MGTPRAHIVVGLDMGPESVCLSCCLEIAQRAMSTEDMKGGGSVGGSEGVEMVAG